MDIKSIMETWQPRTANPRAGVEWWNEAAQKFSAMSMKLPTAENSMALRIIKREGMLGKNGRALDVGCGGGRLSFAMDTLGAEVIGTDFAPRMIEECIKQRKENGSGVNFVEENWHTADLRKRGWYKNFDLVLANTTPAINSADAFLKLMDASRNWVLTVSAVRRQSSVMDGLCKLLGMERDTKSYDDTIAYAFDLLWAKGYCPRVEYESDVWKNDGPLNSMIDDYSRRLSSMRALSDKDESTLRSYLKSLSVDGNIHEETNTTMVAMYWQV